MRIPGQGRSGSVPGPPAVGQLRDMERSQRDNRDWVALEWDNPDFDPDMTSENAIVEDSPNSILMNR